MLEHEIVNNMRNGSVVVDLAIDQGGCVATSRPSTLAAPTYAKADVIHYCATNVLVSFLERQAWLYRVLYRGPSMQWPGFLLEKVGTGR